MKRETAAAGLMALLWSLGLGSCGEKEVTENPEEESPGYVLAKPNALPPAGTKIAVAGLLDFSDVPLVIRTPDGPMVGARTMTQQIARIHDVISPTKVKIVVERNVSSQEIIVGGSPKSSPPQVSPIQGVPLTFELKGESWVGSRDDGAALSEEEQEKVDRLSEQLSSADALGVYGEGPRRVGDKWEVDPNSFPGIGKETDFKGSFKISFDRLEAYEGHQCAVLVGSVNMTGTRKEDPSFEHKMSGTVTFFRSVDYLEDLKVTIEGKMTISESPKEGVTTTVRGPFTLENTAVLQLP